MPPLFFFPFSFFSSLSFFVFLSFYAVDMRYIGIDVSKDTFHAGISDEEVLVFENSKEGIASFVQMIEEKRFLKKKTKIGLEATGIYHLLLCHQLSPIGWKVFVLNPLLASQYITRSIRPVKNDRKDALAIRRAVMDNQGDPFWESQEISCFKMVIREYKGLSRMQSVCKQQIHVLQKTKEFLEGSGERSFQGSFPSVFEELILVFQEKKKQLQKTMKSFFPEIQKLLSSIPGIGPISSAVLVAQIMDISRFPSAKKLAAYCGLDCRVRESGTSMKGKGFLSKRGNSYLRGILFQAAFISKRHDSESKEFYEKKIKEGKHHTAVICALERKLVHRIYAVWKRNTPFIPFK
jgi:transposase